ncbi:transcription factor Ouib [Drosophila persimilis]|uniref:transcription factor Ouib n=1 Tax=Drosophila persimilis TaxID=7234 RepID=UPI000F08BA2A|nr:transcription factor Ouib [Drosophila persimilis]
MALPCRTCGEHAVNPRKLFDENGTDILNNLLKLTGIWLTNRTGFPSHICASCLQHSNDAMAFRELCIRTNKLWYISADSKPADQPLNLDPLMEYDEAAIPEENNEYAKVQIETVWKERNNSSPLSHLTSSQHHREPYTRRKESKEQSEKIDNNGEFQDELLDFDPLLNEDAGVVPKEENPDEVKDKGSSLSSRKSRLDSSSAPKKGLLRGSRKSNIDPLAKKHRYRSIRGFYCDQCGKCFKDKSNLNVHLKRHTGVKQFECEECGRKEFTMHLLSLHMRIKHNGELPYSCKHCGQGFDNCTKRLRHERTTHNECPDTRAHVCHVCRKAFKRKLSLKRHELVHTGEQPFHCETCHVSFNRKSSLRTHNRSMLHIKKVEQESQINEIMDEGT